MSKSFFTARKVCYEEYRLKQYCDWTYSYTKATSRLDTFSVAKTSNRNYHLAWPCNIRPSPFIDALYPHNYIGGYSEFAFYGLLIISCNITE